MTILLIILGWLACAVFAAGAIFADFQGSFPSIAAERRRAHLAESWGMGLLFGPFALPAAIFGTGFLEHGWRLR